MGIIVEPVLTGCSIRCLLPAGVLLVVGSRMLLVVSSRMLQMLLPTELLAEVLTR